MSRFRTLPQFGADARGVAEVVRGIMDGKTNNTGLITLASGGATTTALYDERIGYESILLFAPANTVAMADTAPYGSFQDSTDQAATTLGQASIMSFNTTDYSNGVTVVNNTELTVSSKGIYDIQFSAQFKNTTNDSQSVDIWFKKNGTDLDGSNSRFGMPARKSTGDPSHLIAAMNYYVELDPNDYVEIAWRPTDLGVALEHFDAIAAVSGTTPDIPATPSIILTMNYVAPAATTNLYASELFQGYAILSHWANTESNKVYRYVIVG